MLTIRLQRLQDINDDVSDFTEKQINSLEETKEFYFDKYPVVSSPLILLLHLQGKT